MKKITLLVAGLLMNGSLAIASESTIFSGGNTNVFAPVDYRNAEPVIFMERGIEFMVFLDGQMDFNTVPGTTGGSYYRGPSRTANATYGVAGSQGVRVEHDYRGRVRRVGNVYINYDAFDRVKRIGSVYMSYNRFALSQIGGMTFAYNRNGMVTGVHGFVNNPNRSYTYQTYTGSYGNGYSNSGNYGAGNSGSSGYYYRKTETTGNERRK
ncbi:hypothetical protein LRS05_11455 [Flavobacterium sp. J372]|uniref:hypothetical protein n=1 Tax=Flavobacterium sp. J372 TaxID=2898436 RepID=UPI002151EAEA|nr:hypothetical protein [Flavobacterium sp. J372]MCR5862720.1 hypothetical protein [Flavobacterium sp. J372]